MKAEIGMKLEASKHGSAVSVTVFKLLAHGEFKAKNDLTGFWMTGNDSNLIKVGDKTIYNGDI